MIETAREVFERHYQRSGRVERVERGLINTTFSVSDDDGSRFALQRVSPIFDAAIHENIEAVTSHLAARGLVTPRLVPTPNGERYVVHDDSVWRLMTWIDGRAFDTASSAAQLEAAGALVGRFHAALDDLAHGFRGVRLGVHDTGAHLTRLERALADHADHRLADEVAPLAHALSMGARDLPPLPDLPPRPCHGDLKLSNVLFADASPPGSEVALCLVDLDTLGPMALAHEMGDALRSWCNPRGEDEAPAIELPLIEASIAGYVAGRGAGLSRLERTAILAGLEHVCLELSARFATDALNEVYFGYDARRFPARGEHNLLRARGQWALYRDVVHTRERRAEILERYAS